MLNRMVASFIRVVRLMIVLASRHRTLVLENLALQQQLAVYRRTRPNPAIRWSDRLFWIGLRWGIAAPLDGMANGARDRQAGDRHRPAPTSLRAVVDLEESPPHGTTHRARRRPHADVY